VVKHLSGESETLSSNPSTSIYISFIYIPLPITYFSGLAIFNSIYKIDSKYFRVLGHRSLLQLLNSPGTCKRTQGQHINKWTWPSSYSQKHTVAQIWPKGFNIQTSNLFCHCCYFQFVVALCITGKSWDIYPSQLMNVTKLLKTIAL
jgi:hypothetical protein